MKRSVAVVTVVAFAFVGLTGCATPAPAQTQKEACDILMSATDAIDEKLQDAQGNIDPSKVQRAADGGPSEFVTELRAVEKKVSHEEVKAAFAKFVDGTDAFYAALNGETTDGMEDFTIDDYTAAAENMQKLCPGMPG